MLRDYEVYANGLYWGVFGAESEEDACQIAADVLGTADVGEGHFSTIGMYAILVEE